MKAHTEGHSENFQTLTRAEVAQLQQDENNIVLIPRRLFSKEYFLLYKISCVIGPGLTKICFGKTEYERILTDQSKQITAYVRCSGHNQFIKIEEELGLLKFRSFGIK